MLRAFLLLLVAAAALTSSALAISGCGDSDGAASGDDAAAGVTTFEAGRNAIPPESEAIAGYTESTQEYAEVLTALEDAALAGKGYKATEHARDLEPVERKAVEWFCFTAWQLDVNDEESRLPNHDYLVSRIQFRIVTDLNDGQYAKADQAPYLASIKVALTELDRIVDLASFDGEQTRRYKKSCYLPEPSP